MTNEQINKKLADIKANAPYHFTDCRYDYWLASQGYFTLLQLLNAQGGL